MNYQGKLYQFTTDHAAGAWIGTDVEPYNLKKDIEERYGIYTDSPEFIRAYTDAEGKFLWGIRVDGSVEWSKGVPTPVQNAICELEDKLKTQDIKSLQDAIDVINVSLKPLTDTFSYQDNEEFAHVITDVNGKVLFGIKADGKPYFPKNTMYSVESNQEFLAAWLDSAGHVLFGLRTDGSTYVAKADFLDKIEEIRQLLEDNGIGDDELKQRVEVLEDDVADLQDTFSHQENEEFVYVVMDNERKVLFGIKSDGSPYYPNNEMYHVIQNDEYLAAWVDASGKLLFGLKADGSVYIAKSEYIDAVKEIQAKIKSLSESVQSLTDTFSIVSNDEWLHAVVDAEGKLLLGIKAENGEVVMPKQDTYKVVKNDEWLAAWLDSQDRILFGVKVDGTFWAAKSNFAGGGNYDEQIEDINNTLSFMQGTIKDLADKIADIDTSGIANTVFSVIDDAEERLSVTTDKDERVISYRDKDGVLHENKGIDASKYYLNGEEKDFTDRSEIAGEVTKAAENGAVKLENVDGVSNHNTPNLLVASEMEKTFNDGVNSFTPPNEGYEMSNPIECQAGDWFTRTGMATGMVVVTDENDKNGTRLFNADGTTLGNTFQIPEDMTWVRYIRMAAEVGGASDGSVVICKGKKAYTGNERGDFLTIDKLMVQQNNIPKDIKYLQTSDGRYWELYVDEADFSVKVKEVDPDIITNLPSDFKPWTLDGTFDGQFDRMLIQNNNYFIEIKATGVVKYKYIGNIVNGNYANFEHFYSPTGDDRYGFIFSASDNVIGKGFTLFDGEFNILDTNIGITGYNTRVSDMHDFIYLADDHILLYSGSSKSVQVPGDAVARNVNGPRVTELKKTGNTWNVIGEFKAVDYPQLCTDAYGDLGTIGNLTDSHSNTISIDYDNNLIINCRNWDTWIKVKRTENSNGTVTIGSKTLDYNEAIIGRVGGRHNSGYLDSKRVLNDGFSFTDTPATLNEVSDDAWEEWQWFHSHDVKYWGMKNISGQNYPTYTMFDNNYWTDNVFKSGQYNILNKNNNINNNPQGSGNYYLTNKDGDENYAQYTHSRVIQLSIDWENHKIMDYRVYYIPKMYSREQSGATMYDEGVISIAYSYAGEFGLWDFTTGETEVSGHIYKGAKELFHGKYNGYRICYRANTYKLNV